MIQSDRALHTEAFALIADEGTPQQAGYHPVAQVLGDWLNRIVIAEGRPSLSITPNDVLLAHELLRQYEQRLAAETAALFGGRLK